MHVLKFPTLAQAQERSRTEAAKHIENHTAELWWGAVKCGDEYWLVVDSETPDAVDVPDDSPLESIPDALDDVAQTLVVAQQAKMQRTEAVARIQVTTASGKVFDGDETSQTRMARAVIAMQAAGQDQTLWVLTSQTRMARAVIAMQAAGQDQTLWVLADNAPATVSLDELAEALALAGAEQTRLWVSA